MRRILCALVLVANEANRNGAGSRKVCRPPNSGTPTDAGLG